jgi:EAL domain-containing protein (putative c-di-GMP-specific phosphodiesterase class I)
VALVYLKSKTLLLKAGFALATLLALNVLLFHLLHLQIHQRAMSVVERVAQLPTELRSEENISEIAQQYGIKYITVPEESGSDASLFSASGITLQLEHQKPYIKHFYIITFFNILFVGFLAFFYRWWQVYRVRPKRFLSGESSQSLTDNSALPAVDPRSADSTLFNVFLLVRWAVKLDAVLDVKNHFIVALHKHLSSKSRCSIKYLNSGALAVTYEQVAWGDVAELGKSLHEIMFRVTRELRPDLSRKQIKVGGCFYQQDAEQAHVYQLARAALEIADNNVWQHVHMMPLNKTHETAMNSSEEDFIQCISNGQFVLFFQPLFGFHQQDIIQNEALLRVRHEQLGLIAAKQFIPQLHSKKNLEVLDKAIVEHTVMVLEKEKHQAKVSINLHIANWLDAEFMQWLANTIRDCSIGKQLSFELSADDYYKHYEKINAQQLFFTGLGVSLIIDHVSAPLMVNTLRENKQLEAIKLSVDLVHELDKSAQKQKTIKQIIYQAKRLGVPVYAVGVETQAELECLKTLGVNGAQGYYFAELLQQMELVGY